MSTHCRAKRQLRNVQRAQPSRSLCGASRPALPLKDVFGGTPDTACETHALPIRLSALLNDPQGNQTERVHGFHSSPEHFRGSPDDFLCPRRIRPIFLSALALASADAPFAPGDFAFDSRIKNQTPSHRVAVSRSDFMEGPVKATRQISEKVKVIHSQRTVKTVKSLSGLFQLETPAVQSVPTKTGWGDFTAFALILRMGMGGGGQ